MVADRNLWINEEKTIKLVLTVKGDFTCCLQHVLTTNAGASQSIVKPNIGKGNVQSLQNVRLRTATEESASQ